MKITALRSARGDGDLSVEVIPATQLTQLATELEILLRANSPLGAGLRDASRRWRGPLGPAAVRLADRLNSGVPADEALRSSEELPPVFRSLAAASLGTHRAADILQAYATSNRQLLDLRERLARGMMYPTIIVVLAYLMSLVLISTVLPQMGEMMSGLTRKPPSWAALVERARQTLPIWSWALPLGIVVLASLFHVLIGRRMSVVGWWGALPIARNVLTDIYTSTASRLLAALLDCGVPLPLALSLTAESLSSRRAQAAVKAIADEIRSGVPASRAFHDRSGAPPLWRALFARDSEPGAIHAGLDHIADVLAERARAQSAFLGQVVPVVLIVVIGGLTVTAYAGAVFGPLIEIWDQLGGPQ